MMKSKLSTKALLELELGSSVEEGLQKKKKKGTRTREIKRAAKAATSRGGRQKKKKRDVSVDDHART